MYQIHSPFLNLEQHGFFASCNSNFQYRRNCLNIWYFGKLQRKIQANMGCWWLNLVVRYLPCGGWAGKLFCLVMIIDFLLWRLLQLWQVVLYICCAHSLQNSISKILFFAFFSWADPFSFIFQFSPLKKSRRYLILVFPIQSVRNLKRTGAWAWDEFLPKINEERLVTPILIPPSMSCYSKTLCRVLGKIIYHFTIHIGLVPLRMEKSFLICNEQPLIAIGMVGSKLVFSDPNSVLVTCFNISMMFIIKVSFFWSQLNSGYMI